MQAPPRPVTTPVSKNSPTEIPKTKKQGMIAQRPSSEEAPGGEELCCTSLGELWRLEAQQGGHMWSHRGHGKLRCVSFSEAGGVAKSGEEQ